MTKAYAGIDIGGTAIKAGLLLSTGKKVTSFKIPTSARHGRGEVEKNLIETGLKLIEISRQKDLSLTGIGIGSPGTIRHPEGIVTDLIIPACSPCR